MKQGSSNESTSDGAHVPMMCEPHVPDLQCLDETGAGQRASRSEEEAIDARPPLVAHCLRKSGWDTTRRLNNALEWKQGRTERSKYWRKGKEGKASREKREGGKEKREDKRKHKKWERAWKEKITQHTGGKREREETEKEGKHSNDELTDRLVRPCLHWKVREIEDSQWAFALTSYCRRAVECERDDERRQQKRKKQWKQEIEEG